MCMSSGVAFAAAFRVQGVVIDSLSRETVPYVAVAPVTGGGGVLTDDQGRFLITVPDGCRALTVSSMGFETKTVAVDPSMKKRITVELNPGGVALGEVVARPRRQKYSKKNNPAVEFMKRIATMGDSTDPRRNAYYSYDFYEKITLALNGLKRDNKMFQGFPQLLEYMDTSEVSGSPILNISVKEKAGDYHYRRSPAAEKTYITGIANRGVDEVFNQQSIQTLLEDVLRPIDVYGNDVNILQNRFVSPLSRIAPDFYRFFLTDTLEVDGERCIELSFVPRTSETFGFTGRFYVPEGDTTMFVKKIVMGVPHDINLNFIDRLYINQEYKRAPDGSRLMMRDDMTMEMSVFGQGLYVRRNNGYSGHSFDAPADESLFDGLRRVEEVPGAKEQPHLYWLTHRLVPITAPEAAMGQMMTTLRQNKVYYWGEKLLHILASGYVGTGIPSYIDLGPVNTLISGNTLEGVRLRGGFLSTTNLSRRWFFGGYAAYGTRDHKWKYKAELEYSFHDKERHAREFPVHSLAVSSMFDVDMLGQHYLYTNADNFVLSLKREEDRQMTYHHVNSLRYTLELHNNFSVVATLSHERQVASRFMTFINGYGDVFDHYDETSLSVQLRFAPGEKFFQTRTKRIPVNLDAPVFTITHTIAPRGWLGNRFMLNKTELSFQKRVWFSAFGFTDIILKGGHIWSRTPYPDMLIPNANLSYTIQPESFALMDAMEFINDSYASWDVTYWLNGALFNYIPLLKKLKLREVVGFRGLWGHLSHRNDPEFNNELYRFPVDASTHRMTNTPYMELSAGIDNLFKCLRVDYVWRLTYRGVPGTSKGGLRVALHITF